VVRFKFYAAEHELKQALETGKWWAPQADPTVATAGEDLRSLAGLLEEEHWRMYTAAWRRLHECIIRSQNARVVKTHPKNGPGDLQPSIRPDDQKHMLGAFITVENARWELREYVQDERRFEVNLARSRIALDDLQVADAIDHYASPLADKQKWRERLCSPSTT
jgi:hypothetical protein